MLRCRPGRLQIPLRLYRERKINRRSRVEQQVQGLKPSARGELEITDLNRIYLEADQLYVERMGRGYAWLGTGTHDSLIEASEFVRTIQKRTGTQIACLEEIAYLQGFIDKTQLITRGKLFEKTAYGKYLLDFAQKG